MKAKIRECLNDGWFGGGFIVFVRALGGFILPSQIITRINICWNE